MVRNPLLMLIGILVLGLAGCRSGPRVNYDQRAGADLGAYQTYHIADTAELQTLHPTIYNDLVDERVKAALHAELKQQGYQPAQPGDLRVVIQLQVRSQLRAVGPGVGFGFGLGHGHGHGHSRIGTGVGVRTGTTRADEEILVDLVVSLHDHETGRLQWQGVAENGLSETRRRSSEQLRAVVRRLFDQPPFAD